MNLMMQMMSVMLAKRVVGEMENDLRSVQRKQWSQLIAALVDGVDAMVTVGGVRGARVVSR